MTNKIEAGSHLEERVNQLIQLVNKDTARLEGLRIAAGQNDLAAKIAIQKLNLKPLTNGVNDTLLILKKLPVEELELHWLSEKEFNDLSRLKLKKLALKYPIFTLSDKHFEKLAKMALEELSIIGFNFDKSISVVPGSALQSLELQPSFGLKYKQSFFRQLSKLPIKSLNLGRSEDLPSKTLSFLEKLPLEHFEISWNVDIFEDERSLGNFKSLRSLKLDRAGVTDLHLKQIQNFPLKNLSIDGSYISVNGIKHLESMPLENLDLKSCYHLSSFRDVVRSLQQLPLKKLGLSDLRCFSSADLKLIKNFQLEELDLCLNELEDKDLKHLEKLPLKKLDISFSSGVSGKTLRLLSEIKLPLEDLSLSGIELKNTDLKHLRKLPIKHLDLYGNSWLTDKGLNYLANLPLKSLDITGEPGKSKITDASIPILTNLPLEFLRMQNCQKITDKGWEVLMKLPARVMR